MDGIRQEPVELDLSANNAAVVAPRILFGAGLAGASGQSASIAEVALTTGAEASVLPGSDGLLFYLPFESGPEGGETYLEQSQRPGAKPAVSLRGGISPAIVGGAVGAGVDFPGSGSDPFTGAYLDASDSAAALGNLDQATISFWMSGGGDESVCPLQLRPAHVLRPILPVGWMILRSSSPSTMGT